MKNNFVQDIVRKVNRVQKFEFWQNEVMRMLNCRDCDMQNIEFNLCYKSVYVKLHRCSKQPMIIQLLLVKNHIHFEKWHKGMKFKNIDNMEMEYPKLR